MNWAWKSSKYYPQSCNPNDNSKKYFLTAISWNASRWDKTFNVPSEQTLHISQSVQDELTELSSKGPPQVVFRMKMCGALGCQKGIPDCGRIGSRCYLTGCGTCSCLNAYRTLGKPGMIWGQHWQIADRNSIIHVFKYAWISILLGRLAFKIFGYI
jgi:hypothetical protein